MAAKPNNTRPEARRQAANGISARRVYVGTHRNPSIMVISRKSGSKPSVLYLDGLNFRRIGRLLGVHHTSVMDWVNPYADTLDEAPVPAAVETIEMDELYTYVGSKKNDSTS